MDIRFPDPTFGGKRVLIAREYRVDLWEHQLPPDGSGIAPDEMAWTRVSYDLVDVSDVQEALEWAGLNMDEQLDRFDSGPHGERRYVVYAREPGEDTYLQLLGCDPTRSDDSDNLPHRAGRA